MEILRLAVDSRKVQLVDIALDLIQKLIAYQHIQGPVHSISHRRDPAPKGKRRPTEDEDDLESVGPDSSLPQVRRSEPLAAHKQALAEKSEQLQRLQPLLPSILASTA